MKKTKALDPRKFIIPADYVYAHDVPAMIVQRTVNMQDDLLLDTSILPCYALKKGNQVRLFRDSWEQSAGEIEYGLIQQELEYPPEHLLAAYEITKELEDMLGKLVEAAANDEVDVSLTPINGPRIANAGQQYAHVIGRRKQTTFTTGVIRFGDTKNKTLAVVAFKKSNVEKFFRLTETYKYKKLKQDQIAELRKFMNVLVEAVDQLEQDTRGYLRLPKKAVAELAAAATGICLGNEIIQSSFLAHSHKWPLNQTAVAIKNIVDVLDDNRRLKDLFFNTRGSPSAQQRNAGRALLAHLRSKIVPPDFQVVGWAEIEKKSK